MIAVLVGMGTVLVGMGAVREVDSSVCLVCCLFGVCGWSVV